MVLLRAGGHEGLPARTPELILSPRDREVSSRVMYPSALCTGALAAQVGQAGIGEADQMSGCPGHPIGAMLVVAGAPRAASRLSGTAQEASVCRRSG
jgi:hypothetical protein